jgi:hypothetical protein
MNITKRDAESHRIALTFLGEKMVIAGWEEEEYNEGKYPVICHSLYYNTWTVDVDRYTPDGEMEYGSEAIRLVGFFDIDKSLKRLVDIPPYVIGYYGNGIELWFADETHLKLFQDKYPTITIHTP